MNSIGNNEASNLVSLSNDFLWQGRTICSVANLTRGDGGEFMDLGK